MKNVPRAPHAKRRRTKHRVNGEGSVFQRASDGLWIATTTYNGKTHRFAAREQHDAITKRADWLELRDQGIKPSSDGWLVASWLDHWLAENKPRYDTSGSKIAGWEPTTWASREILVRRHIEPYLGAYQLRALSSEHVVMWQADLHERGRSANTQHDALRTLSTALELARARRHVIFNVADPKQVARPDVPKPEHVQPSEHDLGALLRAIRGDGLEALVWLGLGSGLRRSEVAALRWDDIEWLPDGGAVIVARRRVNYLGKGINRLERDGLKNGDLRRRVHVGGLVVEVLARRWQHQLEQYAQAGHTRRWTGPALAGPEPFGYIFTSPTTGTPIQVRHIDRYFADVRDRAGLDVNRFHALRRAFTTLLDAVGASQRVGMQMAGHRTPEMFRYYQDPMESQQRQAAQDLDRKLRELLDGVERPALASRGRRHERLSSPPWAV
jgi:integrase